MKKRYLSLLLALLMALSCAALADAGIVTESGFPVVTEPITLTIMASQSAVQPDFNTMSMTEGPTTATDRASLN